MNIDFKYQYRFACDVPDGYKTIKSFFETVAVDHVLSVDEIGDIVNRSFEVASIPVKEIDISNDLATVLVHLQNEDTILKVTVRHRPSLVVDGQIFKLEEFDF
jgi:hypothetical protein